MGLIRDLPFPVVALEDTILATCSALVSTAGSTSPRGMLSLKATADAMISTGSITAIGTAQGAQATGGLAVKAGRVIDRTRQPLGANYLAVAVQASLHSSRGSTEADRKLALGVVLQHGDSSGGGDMAEFSTGSRAADRSYFTSARTTDMASWDVSESSGPLFAVSNVGVYGIRGAKQYLRVQARAGKNRVTTGSSGDEQSRVGALATFFGGDQLPPALDTESPLSTSTST